MTKIIYQFDDAGANTGHSQYARPDPRTEDRYLIPRGFTDIVPPDCEIGFETQLDGTQWNILPDFRGRGYWLADGSFHVIMGVGVVLPQDALETQPVIPPEPIPVTVVSMAQCRLALLAAGKLSLVEAIVAEQAEAVKIAWNYASTVERSNPLISSLAQAAGIDEAGIDALFEAAALL